MLRLLWHLRFTMIKTQPRKLASSTGRVSRSLSNQRHVLRNLSESLYEHEIAAAQPITNMKTFKKCTENYMFKSVRVNLTTLLTLHYHSLSLFLSYEEVWSFVASAPVSWWLINEFDITSLLFSRETKVWWFRNFWNDVSG